MKNVKFACALVVSLLAAACAVEKTENPLSPSLAGAIPSVQISAPKALEPSAGALIPGDKQPVTLLLENALSTGVRPLTYVFEVAADAGFTNKVVSRDGIPPGENGRTALRLSDTLGMGRTYYWRGRAEDGANTGPFSAPVPFDVFTPVAFDKPRPIWPAGNEDTDSLRPEFSFVNAPRVGSPAPITYVVEIATGDSFANKIAAWQYSEQQGGQTKFVAPVELPAGAQLFWRVRALEATAIGPWSDTAVFRTPVPVVIAPPAPPGTPPGGACSGNEPINIVECRRNQFNGTMNQSQLVSFLRAVATDLNKARIAGGGFGLLRKTSGAQCNGYSCDILCQGQGNSQRQYDVLIDSDGSQGPVWSGPRTSPGIRIDQCDVP